MNLLCRLLEYKFKINPNYPKIAWFSAPRLTLCFGPNIVTLSPEVTLQAQEQWLSMRSNALRSRENLSAPGLRAVLGSSNRPKNTGFSDKEYFSQSRLQAQDPKNTPHFKISAASNQKDCV